MELNKSTVLQLVEPHFEKDLSLESYYSKVLLARKLLTHTRFDLAFKLLYLEKRSKGAKFARKIYSEHIRAFSLGKFTEPGNEEKNNIDCFIEDFHKTFDSIKLNGFDSSKTLIPLSKNGAIANGAHRVASAIYLDKNVDCIHINSCDHVYDYKFFYSRNVPRHILDVAALTFAKYVDNLYIAFIWPKAKGYDKEIEECVPNIVYRKEIKLNSNGAHNLLSQIYYGESWLGTVEDSFKGAKGKLVECFKSSGSVRIIAFQAGNLAEVLKIKENVRNIFNIGKHSIHVTDTKEEALRVANLVFNDSSIHFLNYAKPNKYISIHIKMAQFKKFLLKNRLDPEEFVLDSKGVLAVYGIRESKDIGYFVNDKVGFYDQECDCHDEELVYHGVKKAELIYNPDNYFYFNDLKFVSFDQVYAMKKKRAGEKDSNDCKMMEALIENNVMKKFFAKFKQNFYYMKVRFVVGCINTLKKIGLYDAVRLIVKGRK